MKGWKFGMILVEILEETGEEVCELVELYALDKPGEYSMWCKARIMGPSDLALAYEDIQRDGVERWFYENGTFTSEINEYTGEQTWDWEAND